MAADGDVEATGGIRVSYTVKELLARIDGSLASINVKLDLKADAHDLERLSKRVDSQGERMTTLERRVEANETRRREQEEERENEFSKREKLLGLLLAAVAVSTPYILHFGGS